MRNAILHFRWLLLFVAAVYLFLNHLYLRYPLVGHDHWYWFHYLLLGKWHFMRQGILPFRYIPQFCGGNVGYGTPYNMYYSVTQLLSIFTNPWVAYQLTAILMLVFGYLGWYLVGTKVMKMSSNWSYLYSLILTTNGFYLMHVAIGHGNFLTFPLVSCLLLLLHSRSTDQKLILLLRAVGFGILAGIILYAGGFIVLMISGLLFCCTIPLDVLLHRSQMFQRTKHFMILVPLFSLSSLCICISKIVSVYSFMRFFPRHAPLSSINGNVDALTYIVHALFYIPQKSSILNAPWGPHEKSMLVSPVVLMGLICGFVLIFVYSRRLKKRIVHTSFILIYVALFLWLLFQFVKGDGPVVDVLHTLPVLNSQRVATRYLFIGVVFFSTAGMWSMSRFVDRYLLRFRDLIIISSALITLFVFHEGNVAVIKEFDLDIGNINLPDFYEFSHEFNESLERGVLEVTKGKSTLIGVTGMDCDYGVLDFAGNPQLRSLHPGSVYDVEQNYFNLMNPACYQYPKENDCNPGDRISVSDKDNLERFINGMTTTWKVSALQWWSDRVSLISVISFIMLCLLSPLLRYVKTHTTF